MWDDFYSPICVQCTRYTQSVGSLVYIVSKRLNAGGHQTFICA